MTPAPDPPVPDQRSACIFIPETTYQTDYVPSPVRICVIDLGTNSFHAVIVDAHPNGSFRVIDRMKEMVRLGQRGLGEGMLPEDAQQRGLKALRRINLLARGWDTSEFLAFATSAIREAKNGGAFIERVRNEIGLRIRPISGEQEARLIYQGVRRAVDMPDPTLIVDIGGGSVEFIVCTQKEASFARSLKLGAARMTERFVSTDPISDKEQQQLRDHYHAELAPVLEAAREHGVKTIVGSSGTIKNLARLCVEAHGDASRTIFQQDVPYKPFRKTLRTIIKSTQEKRIELAAVDEKRVDQIGAGAILMDVLGEALEPEQLRVSSHALREGMVVYFIEQNYTRLRRMAPFAEVRRRSVHEIAFRYDWEERHCQHVAATALFIFDACRSIYEGPASDSELLEYAAILHDIGYHISHRKHHKHSRYLIRNSNLQGFLPEENKILSLVARYHRSAFPKSRHKHYRKLSSKAQQRVRQLAAFLRIAEGLDRSHFQNVTAMQISLNDEALNIDVETKGDPQLEVWAAKNEAALFEDVFGRTVNVEAKNIPVKVNGQSIPVSVTHSTAG